MKVSRGNGVIIKPGFLSNNVTVIHWSFCYRLLTVSNKWPFVRSFKCLKYLSSRHDFCTEENNRFPHLLETLYWVKQQSYRDYLHVVVDDGSTDGSVDVLEQIAAADSRLTICRKSNGGASSAVNYGVDHAFRLAKPEFITICHSDDIMQPESETEARWSGGCRIRSQRLFIDDGRRCNSPSSSKKTSRVPRSFTRDYVP